mgnify:CR=1 FL=1
MVKIVDHAYEPESVIQSNLAKIKNALAKNEKVVVYHSEGFVHGRLAGIPGVEYKMCKALRRRKEVILRELSVKKAPSMSVHDSEELARFNAEYEAFLACLKAARARDDAQL